MSVRFISLRDFAERVGMSYDRVRKLAQSRQIPALRLGRTWRVADPEEAEYFRLWRETGGQGRGYVTRQTEGKRELVRRSREA